MSATNNMQFSDSLGRLTVLNWGLASGSTQPFERAEFEVLRPVGTAGDSVRFRVESSASSALRIGINVFKFGLQSPVATAEGVERSDFQAKLANLAAAAALSDIPQWSADAAFAAKSDGKTQARLYTYAIHQPTFACSATHSDCTARRHQSHTRYVGKSFAE